MASNDWLPSLDAPVAELICGSRLHSWVMWCATLGSCRVGLKVAIEKGVRGEPGKGEL